MTTGRLEAFSDGVLAIIITMMVLELKPPEAPDFSDLHGSATSLLTYLLSFVYIGIYWNNHHHLFQMRSTIDGTVLWANLHLLFWLSLYPVHHVLDGRALRPGVGRRVRREPAAGRDRLHDPHPRDDADPGQPGAHAGGVRRGT